MAIELTASAARHLRRMLEKRGHGLGLRLGTRKSGCSGFSYVVEYAEESRNDDVVFEDHDVKVVVDTGSLAHLDGMQVDYLKTNAVNQGFEFGNPRVRNACGCGKSFSV